ncbi:helix-turn-helix transcriptional regulator [Marinicellulosiphila megalodicopiae]|uniref:helix-turn-helix transcriptional regulator n=1 Tax=Marinicellulosiphila megalodicopiae TaxID=2724896 RepID=UPI003BAE1F2B
MSRTHLLFQITQIIRSRKFTTAQYLADRLNISTRSVYRYINELSVSGIPIISQTGKGYWIDENFNLTPLHLSEDELIALNLGAKLVKAIADPFLADAAQQLLDKIQSVTPKSNLHLMSQSKIHAPLQLIEPQTAEYLSIIRLAVDSKNKIEIEYSDQHNNSTTRIFWPLALAFWGKDWTVASWCETRQDFRAFRIDRIQSLKKHKATFLVQPDKNLEAFIEQQRY